MSNTAYYLDWGSQSNNVRVDFGSAITLNGAFSLTIVASNSTGGSFYISGGNSTGGFELYRNSSGVIQVFVSGSGVLTGSTSLSSNKSNPDTIVVTRNASNLITVTVNNITQGSFTESAALSVSTLGERPAGAWSRSPSMALYSLNVDGQFIMNENTSTGSVLFNDAGANNGTLVGFPTDNSQWVFYASGGSTVSPSGISSDEAFGSPSIVLGSVALGATAISSEEVFGSPSLLAGASSVQPSSIPTGEALGSPNIDVGAVLLEPVSIVSEELFGTPDVVSGLTAITPVGISSAEAFGAGLVQNLLVIIEPLGIPAEALFGNPLVLGGDRIVIPIANRVTWNKIASYLRTLSFTGSDNDVIIAWLRSEGLAGGQYNDLWVDYFESVGFTGGSLTDNQALWKKGENG